MLGSGSFGAVARVSKHNKYFALKALAPEEENDLYLEGSILASLSHAGIPRYVEAFSDGGVDYLVQELVNGYPLSYYVANGRRFTESEAKRLLFQLLEIIAYLHESNESRPAVIHRDLRLSNLFWFEDKIYLIDFGFARYYYPGDQDVRKRDPEKNSVQMSKNRPGTKTYTLARKEIAPSSDLFGAGVVGLDLFTNWIEDEALFLKPWQEILPASEEYKALIETLLSQEAESSSATDVLKKFAPEWHAS